jgi:cell division protein FtsW
MKKAPKLTSMTAPARRRRLTLGADPWLVVLTIVLISFGLVMVYSASWDVSWRLLDDPNALFRSQLLHIGFGLVTLLVAAWFPVPWLRRFALPIMVGTILSLIAVLLINLGADHKRAFIGESIQPSELAKLSLIIYLAVWMDSKGDRLAELGYGLMPLILIMGLVGGLILMQPDLSAGLTVVVVAVTMFYLAGARLWQVAMMMLGGSGFAYILVRVTTTGQERWKMFVGGLVDLQEASYHVQQSLQSFYSGRILGRGLGASRGKFGFLPAPHTDSIFAIVGEELGLLGALVIIALFCLLVWRGFHVALHAPTRLQKLLASGITFWVGVEALINMSVLLGLLPFAGNALPFFSYGGSSLVTTLTGVGLLLNISRKVPEADELRGQVANLGSSGRNWGRRISRLSRRRSARQAH